MQMNVQMLSQVILKVMNQIMQLYKLWPQIWNQMIRKILIDIQKIQNIKLMKGKNGTTSFLPERQKGGKVRFSEEVMYIPNKKRTCLTKDQATHIYEEVEKNEPINIQIVSQGTENAKKVGKGQIKEEEDDMIENPYQKAITNINIKDENKVEQMINWSIFSDKLRYVDSSIYDTPKLTIRPLE